MFQHFVDHFGEGMYKNLIVLFTGEDNLDYDNMKLEDFIKGSPPALKEILRLAGNRYIAFNNRYWQPLIGVCTAMRSRFYQFGLKDDTISSILLVT